VIDSEPQTVPDPGPADAPAPTRAAAPRRRSVWPLLVLILLAGAGGAAWWAWSTQQALQLAEREQGEWRGLIEELRVQQQALERELSVLRDRQRSLDTRLGDSASSQRVLREEVLAVGERAVLLEDAIARLAQSRQEGAQAMLLEEAEFLLLMGEERLVLFRDPAAAIRALGLADVALAGLQEPVYATLRQTLAQEVAGLRALPPDPLPAARSAIGGLLADLATLPAPDAEATPADGQSRLAALLGQLVTIRKLDADGAPLDPLTRSARRAALALQLQLGLAALERGDLAGWHSALAIGREALSARELFASSDPRVQAHARALAALDADPAPTPAIGATLRELRGLRATRRLGTPALPAVPAATAAPAPAPSAITELPAGDVDATEVEPAPAEPEPLEVE